MRNSALVTLAPIISHLVASEAKFKNTIEENLLLELR